MVKRKVVDVFIYQNLMRGVTALYLAPGQVKVGLYAWGNLSLLFKLASACPKLESELVGFTFFGRPAIQDLQKSRG